MDNYDKDLTYVGRKEALEIKAELEKKARANGWNPERLHSAMGLSPDEASAYVRACGIVDSTVDLDEKKLEDCSGVWIEDMYRMLKANSIRGGDATNIVDRRISKILNSLILHSLVRTERNLIDRKRWVIRVGSHGSRRVTVDAPTPQAAMAKVRENLGSNEEIEEVSEA